MNTCLRQMREADGRFIAKPHLCLTCGETAPEKFYEKAKSECKTCTCVRVSEKRDFFIDLVVAYKYNKGCTNPDCPWYRRMPAEFWDGRLLEPDHHPRFEKLGDVSDYLRMGSGYGLFMAVGELKKSSIICKVCHMDMTKHNYNRDLFPLCLDADVLIEQAKQKYPNLNYSGSRGCEEI